jgi:hypothetical protein
MDTVPKVVQEVEQALENLRKRLDENSAVVVSDEYDNYTARLTHEINRFKNILMIHQNAFHLIIRDNKD